MVPAAAYNKFRGKLNNGLNSVFGKFGGAMATPIAAGVVGLLAVILAAVLIPGMSQIETVRSISELYVQQGTRLQPEQEFIDRE